jgi:beta-glucosidase
MDMLGSWHGAGDHTKVVTLLEGLKKRYPDSKISYSEGCDFYSMDNSGFSKAINAARSSDVTILAIGENQAQSGEAASRSNLNFTGMQEMLANELIKTGKPLVILIMAERMLTFPDLENKSSTLLYGWHLGTRSGDALAAVLSGDYNPSGKLVMTMPKNVGQIPIYYNYKTTGRPINDEDKYTTKYLDVENTPLYPFGFGLSYTEFEYGALNISSELINMNDTLSISIEVSNTGRFDGEEIVQLYIRDLVGSVTRPIMELKGFQKVFIGKGSKEELHFKITSEDLKFINGEYLEVSEPGDFEIMVGPNSASYKKAIFTLKSDG